MATAELSDTANQLNGFLSKKMSATVSTHVQTKDTVDVQTQWSPVHFLAICLMNLRAKVSYRPSLSD